jgi:SAM-dependent MidA family methyltransferase
MDIKICSNQVKDEIKVVGPVTQSDFLHSLGIEVRMATLLQNAREKIANDVISAYGRLTDEKQMGATYKVMSITTPELVPLLPGFD